MYKLRNENGATVAAPIIGKCDTGKTTLAAHIGQIALRKKEAAYYCNIEEFLRVIKNKDMSRKTEIIYRYMLDCSVIIIDDQLSVSGGGVDGLFFKINADAQFLQLPYRFQKGHGIPGKAGYGLCDDVINFSGTTVGEHPLEVLPAVSGAGLGFVGVNAYILPAVMVADVGAVLFKGFQIAKTAVLIYEGTLIILFSCRVTNQANAWNIFHIYLDSLTRILHLFIRFCNVFRVWQFDGVSVDPAQELIQAGDGAGVASLAQLYPEYQQTSVGVPAAHIPDQFDLSVCVLSGMDVGPVGTIGQRENRSIIRFAPAIDILPAGLVVNRCGCYAVLQRIFNDCLLKTHIPCYLIHGE